MSKYFILVANDTENVDGKIKPALDIAKNRISRMTWPLYLRTHNRRRISVGDICLIYLAGRKELSQHVVYEALVDEVNATGGNSLCEGDIVTEPAATTLQFSKVERLAHPRNIRNILPKLSFCPRNLSKWGAIFQGGCTLISKQDYNIIISSTGKTAMH
jgi:hypothetical protein